MTSYWQADCTRDFLGDTSPRPLCEVFNIVSTSRIFEVEKDKIGEIMDGAVPANARQQIKANVAVSILG